MLNPELKLNPKLFDADVEQVPIRKGFGEGLLKAGELDARVVGLCADLTESTQMEAFAKKFPNRYVEIGVAEQNLATVASGMAAMGKIPFMTSYATFSPGRNWEQIRTTIAYNNRPVKVIGSHAGISVGPDGGTHQALEDMAIMRALPRMVVISPCDAIEARKATMATAKTADPTYIRLAREKTPIMTTDDTPFEIGKAQIVFRSEASQKSKVKSQKIRTGNGDRSSPFDVGIIATGALLHKALTAAQKFTSEGRSAVVMNLATIKPLDEQAIIRLATDAGAIVTVEEHQIMGGMGSAVAECLAKHHPVPIEFIGVVDKFGQSGKPDELIELYEMGETHVYKAVHKVLMRK
ncbi:MAG: transketolase family protein [Patescibacteria group bacterium]|nr:transketolase family protein [Patescibacteria group bacterium]MDE2172901.1 transketolase family protein [Patescibacteria group bacterium]